MEKNKLIAINNNDNKTNVYIIRENNEAEFFINIRFEEVINKLDELTIDDLCLSTPGFDIRCMQHENL